MKRLLRLRLSLLLVGMAAVPIVALPYAESIRAGWKRYWEPQPAVALPLVYSDFVEVRFAYYELDVVESLDVIPRGCEIPIDYDDLRAREHLDFVESPDFDTAKVSTDVDLSPPVDRNLQFLKELAEIRCVLTDPVDSPKAPTTDETTREQGILPSVGP